MRDITARRVAEEERERLLSRERDQRLRAQRLERRASYLSEVQRALDASIDDYEDALRKLARLVVPRLGDWCVVHTLEDGELRMVAVEHSDPNKRSLAWELQRRYPANLDIDRNLAEVLQTGKPDLISELPPDLLRTAARNAEHAEILRTLGLHSAMIVPLRARGQVLGAISFALAETDQRFDDEDLNFAMEVARRGALSISNARLYHEVQQRQEEIEFLAKAGIELDTTMDVEQTLRRLAELTVPYLGDGCMVDLLEEGERMRRVASASANPEVAPVLSRLRTHELDFRGDHPIAKAMRSRRVQVVEDITPEMQRSWSPDQSYLADLRDWPARAAVVAPMVARGRVLGTIAVAAFGDRVFTRREIVLVEELARRAAISVYNSRLYSERSYIASRLQHSLLPPHLPEVPGMEIAARFRPAGEANEVGGDFYDIFETASGRWALVIGDVCGKGADAAAVTAIARYTLRAAAIQAEDGPEHALRLLNDVLMQQVSPDRFCTVAYATLDLGDGVAKLSVASGGHPTPLIVRADGKVTPIGDPGTLLGVLPNPVSEGGHHGAATRGLRRLLHRRAHRGPDPGRAVRRAAADRHAGAVRRARPARGDRPHRAGPGRPTRRRPRRHRAAGRPGQPPRPAAGIEKRRRGCGGLASGGAGPGTGPLASGSGRARRKSDVEVARFRAPLVALPPFPSSAGRDKAPISRQMSTSAFAALPSVPRRGGRRPGQRRFLHARPAVRPGPGGPGGRRAG